MDTSVPCTREYAEPAFCYIELHRVIDAIDDDQKARLVHSARTTMRQDASAWLNGPARSESNERHPFHSESVQCNAGALRSPVVQNN